MNTKIDRYIAEHESDIIETLRELIRIPSVRADAMPNAPFGNAVRDSLDFMLKRAADMGFECANMDGYIGCIDFGSGDELLGVMCHLDVVPDGIGWSYPPYDAVLIDGKVYGRGALDNKGPAVSTLFALAAIKASGIPMRRRVRIMLGCDEESSWECMEHYAKHGETPHLAFSPDADYPVVNSEKGILHASFKKEYKSTVSFESGSRPNVVPNDALITVPAAFVSLDELIGAAQPVIDMGFPVDYTIEDDKIVITVTGLGAHAALPHLGKNAMQAGIKLLSMLPLEGEDAEVVKALHSAFNMELHGESLGADMTDESGQTSVNPGVMRWNANGISEFSVDMRCPKKLALDEALSKLETALNPVGLTVFDRELKAGHFVPRDSELVSRLLDVYSKRTGEKAEPLAIGGGTYARAIENAVAFGCERIGSEAVAHMPDEYISVEDMMFNTYMIADAIIALAAKEE